MHFLKKAFYYISLLIIVSSMLFGAYNHIAAPEFYNNFIPDFLPKLIVNYISAIIEFIIGVLVIFPKMRVLGAKAFIILMICFFPVHIWDLFREEPAIGSFNLAVVRIFIQFLFIYMAYFVSRLSIMVRTNN